MAENIPISETRRVVIEYEIRVPHASDMARSPAPTPAAPAAEVDIEELAEQVRRELIRAGSRNPDIFGGRA